MKTIYILDGYNVIHAIPALKKKLNDSLESARRALLAECAGLKASRKDIQSITVVFDGQKSGEDYVGGIHVLFTRRREEADDRILEIIRDSPDHCGFCIVSNDNFVFNNCRAHAASVISVSQFYSRLKSCNSLKEINLKDEEKPSCTSPKGRLITEAYKKYLTGRQDEGILPKSKHSRKPFK